MKIYDNYFDEYITLTPSLGGTTTFTANYKSVTATNHTSITGAGLNHISGGYVDGGGAIDGLLLFGDKIFGQWGVKYSMYIKII